LPPLHHLEEEVKQLGLRKVEHRRAEGPPLNQVEEELPLPDSKNMVPYSLIMFEFIMVLIL
jgi:hypothetical protein